MNRTRPCADCQEVKWIHARDLCSACYMRHRRHGTLPADPRANRTCVRCNQWRPHCARNLCNTCHYALRTYGGLDDYPRKTWPRAELLAEYDHLRNAGVNLDEAARRLGISRYGIQKAIERAGRAA